MKITRSPGAVNSWEVTVRPSTLGSANRGRSLPRASIVEAVLTMAKVPERAIERREHVGPVERFPEGQAKDSLRGSDECDAWSRTVGQGLVTRPLAIDSSSSHNARLGVAASLEAVSEPHAGLTRPGRPGAWLRRFRPGPAGRWRVQHA